MRLGLVTPVAWIALVIVSRNPPPWLRESLGAAIMLVVMASAVLLMLDSRSTLAPYAHYPFLLVVIYATSSSGCGSGTPASLRSALC